MAHSRVRTLLLTLLLLAPAALPAQELEEEFPELEDDELTYVGLGGGITPTLIFMDLEPLNRVTRELSLDEFEGPLALWGGSIIFTPIFITNMRFGLFGAIGYHRHSKELTLENESYTRTLRFGVRFMGGLQAEYAMPITRKLTVLPGFVFGRGSYALELTQSRTSSEEFADNFDPALFDGRISGLNRAARILNTHQFLLPGIAIEYAVTGTFMGRISGGYHLGIGASTWEDEGGTLYHQVPDIEADGPFVQAGLFFGLFQQ
jgi:hypothetical protein